MGTKGGWVMGMEAPAGMAKHRGQPRPSSWGHALGDGIETYSAASRL